MQSRESRPSSGRSLLLVVTVILVVALAWGGAAWFSGRNRREIPPSLTAKPSELGSAAQSEAPFELAAAPAQRAPSNVEESEDPDQESSPSPGADDVEAESPEESYRKYRRIQFEILLNGYDDAVPSVKSSRLSGLTHLSIAVILDSEGRYALTPKVPTTVVLPTGPGDRMFSLNGREYRFNDREFPVYIDARNHHMDLPSEAYAPNSTYQIPPELESRVFALVERAQRLLGE